VKGIAVKNRNACIDGHSLLALKARILTPDDEAALMEHVGSCAACEARLIELLAESPEIAELKRQVQHSADVTPAAPPTTPTTIARDYIVERTIGQGSQGRVVLARHAPSSGIVAIKLLNRADQDELREARRAMELRSDHIVRVIGVMEEHQPPLVIMEYIDGPTLREWMRDRNLSVDEIVLIGGKLAQALADAHDHCVIHRDVKPGNILVENWHGELRVKLTDFGIATRFTDPADDKIIRGTPTYIAPEVANGKPATLSSDLFSLGCVLYEMCTQGTPAFPAKSLDQSRQRLRRPPPDVREKNPQIPDWLATLVHSLLELNPEARYPNAHELARTLVHGRLAAPTLVGVSVEEVEIERYRQPFEFIFGPFRSTKLQPLTVNVQHPPQIHVSWKLSGNNSRLDDDGQGRYALRLGVPYKIDFRANDSLAQFVPAARLAVPLTVKLVPLPWWSRVVLTLAVVLLFSLGYFTFQRLQGSRGQIVACAPQADNMYQLTGTARIDSRNFLYLIVETSDGHWPKGPAIAITEDGRWSHRIHHAPQFGTQASFALWEVTPDGRERIQMWLNNATGSGVQHFNTMTHIEGQRLDTIVVTAQRPNATLSSVKQQAETLRVEGTATGIPADQQLLLAIRSQNLYWPKEARITVGEDGRWAVDVKHQPQRDATVELTVWLVGPDGQKQVEDWLKRGREADDYEPLTTIENGTLLDSIRLSPTSEE
jgi:serine/threonine protein kinase